MFTVYELRNSDLLIEVDRVYLPTLSNRLHFLRLLLHRLQDFAMLQFETFANCVSLLH